VGAKPAFAAAPTTAVYVDIEEIQYRERHLHWLFGTNERTNEQ
jgi:hypothetical protein